MRIPRALRIPVLLLTLLAPMLVAVTPAEAGVTARYIFTGKAFDACEAPTVSTMQQWLSSPYRAVGIYIGGANRSCPQPNLTSSWVTSVRGQGWSLLPIYVGRQAPCTGFRSRISPSSADTQGIAAADDAIAKAVALGIGARNPIYLDIENYNRRSGGCSAAVKTYVDKFTARLTARGYVAGVYGSTSSLMVDLVSWRADPRFRIPPANWFARWNGSATLFGEPTVPNNYWVSHQRIHQYKADESRTYGGRTLRVDTNQVDAPAVRPGA